MNDRTQSLWLLFLTGGCVLTLHYCGAALWEAWTSGTRPAWLDMEELAAVVLLIIAIPPMLALRGRD